MSICTKLAATGSYSPELRTLSGADLLPSEFKWIMMQHFGQHFSPKELGAICSFLKAADGVRISSKGLEDHMKKLQRMEWERMRRDAIAVQKKRSAVLSHEPLRATNDVEYDSSDERSFVEKLRDVIKRYNANPAAYSDELRVFKEGTFSPTAFKDAFLRVFSVALSRSECGFLLGLYDDRGAGLVNGQTFLNSFFKVSRNLSSLRDLSNHEIVGLLRLQDTSRPLIEGFNESHHWRRSPSPESNVETVKTFDSIGTMKPSNRVILPMLLAETDIHSPPLVKPLVKSAYSSDRDSSASKPLLVSSLHSRRARTKVLESSTKLSSLPPQKRSDDRRTASSGEVKRKEFVFPALLSSAPIFSLSAENFK